MGRKLLVITAIVVALIISACSSGQVEEPSITESTQTATVTEQIDNKEDVQETESQSDMDMADSETQSESPDHPGDMAAESGDDDSMSDSSDDSMSDSSDDSMSDSSDDSMSEDMSDEDEMADESVDELEMVVERPEWHRELLVNSRTGETFSLADFEGKTVFVEPMATWCSNCRKQLSNVKDARQQLADEDVVFLAISVETTIDDATLANYAENAGFDWLFAVATPDFLRQLADEFGQTIANPPATPHFIIRADGTNTELVTGIEAPSQIVSQITAAQG